VRPDATRGTLVTITVAGEDLPRAAVESRIKDIMSQYAFAYAVEWHCAPPVQAASRST
jgi:hypothetical protein